MTNFCAALKFKILFTITTSIWFVDNFRCHFCFFCKKKLHKKRQILWAENAKAFYSEKQFWKFLQKNLLRYFLLLTSSNLNTGKYQPTHFAEQCSNFHDMSCKASTKHKHRYEPLKTNFLFSLKHVNNKTFVTTKSRFHARSETFWQQNQVAWAT